MRALRIAIAAASLLIAAAQAHAQCSDWHSGPLDNGTAPNGANGPVYAFALWDSTGLGLSPALVAGGNFSTMQGATANRIAILGPGNSTWQDMGSPYFADVRSLTVFNNQLVAGLGGWWHNGLTAARWTGSSWQSLDYNTCVDNTYQADWVRALTVLNGSLYAGGNFTSWGLCSVGGQFGYGAFQWNGSQDWNLLASPSLTVPYQVYALTSWNGLLFAGGDFNECCPIVGPYLASWNGASWSSIGGGVNQLVTSFQGFNGQLIVGGGFTTAGPLTGVNGVAGWTGSNWVPYGPGFSDTVQCLTVYNGQLVAGGSFLQAGSTTVNHIAVWNGSSWQPLGGGTNGAVRCLTVWDGDLIAGGDFTTADGFPANYIARWNGFTWEPFGGGRVTDVYALTPYAGSLVGAGTFTQSATGMAASDVVGWDGANLYPYGSGMNGTVFALKSYTLGIGVNRTFELVAAGAFTQAGGTAVNYIAHWDQKSVLVTSPVWQPFGAGFDQPPTCVERATVAGASNTYAGGRLTSSNGTALNYVARWNSTSGLWESLAGGMNGFVYALRAFGGYLYAGGAFTYAGGVHTGGLARWDGTSWSAVGGIFNGTVAALEVYNGVLAIGGSFPGINSSPNLAYYDGTNYGTFSTGGTNAPVYALHAVATKLYIGGSLTAAGGGSANHVAMWDGSAWHDVAGGADGAVLALSDFAGEIDAGGTFATARGGAVNAACWARYTGTGTPWISRQPVNESAAAGQTVSFTAQPASGYTETLNWSRFGVPLSNGPTGKGSTISGATTSTLTITNVQHTDYGDYRLVIDSACGNDTSAVATLSLTGGVGVDPPGGGREAFVNLAPNPAQGAVRLRFSLARGATVEVKVRDIAGRAVRSLLLGWQEPGDHDAAWDGRDMAGATLHAGIYFVTLEVDGRPLGSRRVTFLR